MGVEHSSCRGRSVLMDPTATKPTKVRVGCMAEETRSLQVVLSSQQVLLCMHLTVSAFHSSWKADVKWCFAQPKTVLLDHVEMAHSRVDLRNDLRGVAATYLWMKNALESHLPSPLNTLPSCACQHDK